MAWVDDRLPFAGCNRMTGDDLAIRHDPQTQRQHLHFNQANPGAVRHRVPVALVADQTFAADFTLQCQQRLERHRRQRLKGRLFGLERLCDNLSGAAMAALIGYFIEPAGKALVEVLKGLEPAGGKKNLLERNENCVRSCLLF